MIFFILVLLFLIFNGAEFAKPKGFNQNYISKDDTLAIKGIFVALILISHGKQYLTLDGTYDGAYVALQNHLNQMVVAMFMFYSGFGMMESVKRKQFAYIKTIPQKRFPNLLLTYDVAVLLFSIMDITLGKNVTLKNLFIALIGWNGIGNSSWYVFVILALYILTFFAFIPKRFSENKVVEFICLVILSVLSMVLIFTLKKFDKPQFWFNTLILYAGGFWYSYFKDIIEKVLMKNNTTYFVAFAGVILVYVYSYLHRWDRLLFYTIWAFMFTALVVLITMKVSIKNSFLKFLGEHVFSIYILQRIPMIILANFGVNERHKYIFLIVSFTITFAMAVPFDIIMGKISALIWKPKKKVEAK